MCIFTNRVFNIGTSKKLIILTVCSVILLFYEIFVYSASSSSGHRFRNQSILINAFKPPETIVQDYYRQRQSWPTSNLGSILFKNVNSETFRDHERSNKTFLVLIWEHWDWLRVRHVHSFNKRSHAPTLDFPVSPLAKTQERYHRHPKTDSKYLFDTRRQGVYGSNVNKNIRINYVNVSEDILLRSCTALVLGRNTDPVSRCSVRNCIFTGNNTLLDIADAVVIHIQKGVFPNPIKRKPEQRWIFLNDESPIHAFSMTTNKPNLSSLANMFNWSMTYRSDADIPVPYGRTIPLSQPSGPIVQHSTTVKIPYWRSKQRDVLAAILISNCVVSYRMKYLHELKQHIAVDVHGKCSENNKTSCPGHFRSDCGIMARYLFYLVFENSMCKEYLTEKGFYHAYSKGAIPVIIGPSLEDCNKVLPPNSYLHVDSFKTPLDLANEMIHISENLGRLLSYHKWRNYFEVVNEHGYFGTRSFHFCRVCEALNYNDQKEKTYSEEDLGEFLDVSKTCR